MYLNCTSTSVNICKYWNANFYIGKSYWNLGEKDKALPYFLKVDKIFVDKNYIRPDLLENYELLLDYYKSIQNAQRQLYYIRQLLKADSIIYNRFRYLSVLIHREYDTRELLLEKKNIEKSLERRKHNDLIFISISSAFFCVLLLIAYRHIRNKNRYKQNFEQLMSQNQSIRADDKISTAGIEDINKDTVSSIMKQLEKFEKEKKFLEKDLMLAKLAVAFNTNINYLSKIIYHSRGKKFADYINDLKVDHLIQLMKEDKILRNYTNKALAEEIGFSSTQRFAGAFYARTGIPAIYFVEQLKKSDYEDL